MPSDFIDVSLQKRWEQNAFRELVVYNNLIDFSSNDYLGFARSSELFELAEIVNRKYFPRTGSGASRLISGNSEAALLLEKKLADFFKSEAALITNSGYDANLGLFSAIGKRQVAFVYDEWIHASVIDGMRLSFAKQLKFKHNDLNDLEKVLSNCSGDVFIITESVFSMDGDLAPLIEIVNLAKKYNAEVIVDEAHATGIYGMHGEGCVVALNLQEYVFARVHTFGKAWGVHGAIVVGSKKLYTYLVNFSRPVIYSTFLPFASLAGIQAALELNSKADKLRVDLFERIIFFKKHCTNLNMLKSDSAIQGLVIGGNNSTKEVASILQQNNFLVKPILSPTVPEGTERLRICIHTFNSLNEISDLCKQLHVANNK